MAKKKKVEKTEDQIMIDEFSNEIESTDYGFVFNQDGQLKAVYVPFHGQIELPTPIKKVFKLAGISNPDTIQVHTLH